MTEWTNTISVILDDFLPMILGILLIIIGFGVSIYPWYWRHTKQKTVWAEGVRKEQSGNLPDSSKEKGQDDVYKSNWLLSLGLILVGVFSIIVCVLSLPYSS